MLKSGAVDVNFQNHYGDSALILACWYGHVEITRALIDARADVDMVNCDGNGALNCAAYHGFVNVASVLLQHGATVDIEDKVTGKTALIKAAYVGHAQVAQMLLQRGANKNLRVAGLDAKAIVEGYAASNKEELLALLARY